MKLSLGNWKVWAIILGWVGVAAGLRLVLLGTVFHSSDNVELAVRILKNSGWGWMGNEPYGVFISAWVKIWALFWSSLGFPLNEFTWKSGVAVVGIAQVPLAYLFSRRMGLEKGPSLFAAASFAVLPLHIFQSRYLWGYEVFGVLFLLPALFSWDHYLRNPSLRSGLRASLAIGLYFLSHGYFLPLAPALALWFLLGLEHPFRPLLWLHSLKQMVFHGIWVFPLLFYPLFRASLRHALSKNTRLGFYVDDHFLGFLGNLGWPLLLFFLLSLGFSLWKGRGAPRSLALKLFLSGLIYFLPLWFLTPPGITVVRGYMLAGTALWAVASAFALGSLSFPQSRWFLGLGAGILLWTGMGTGALLFSGNSAWGTAIVVERGGIPPDPCLKAAGAYIQTHFSPETHVMFIHRGFEPPNAWYYAARTDSTWFDLSLEASLQKFYQAPHWVDVLVADGVQADSLGQNPDGLSLRAWFSSHPKVKTAIYSRQPCKAPSGEQSIEYWNAIFDEYLSTHACGRWYECSNSDSYPHP